MKKYKVGVCGAGFVGTACEIGFEKIANISVYDKYKPSQSLQTVVDKSDMIFICVPSPMSEDGSCSIEIVEEVCDEINKIARKQKMIIIKSTVPPGTTNVLQEKYKNHIFCFNPEFLTEKNFINDFKQQDRIVLGFCENIEERKYQNIVTFYETFISTQLRPGKIYTTSSDAAELAKYTANSFLAMKVAFFNEIYEICNAANIDFEQVRDIATSDKRIGASHSSVPGPDGKLGFGGKCFPKDLNSLSFFAKQYGLDPVMVDSTWVKNLLVREQYDWEEIPGAVTSNLNFDSKK